MFRMLIAAGIIFGVVLLWAWIQRKAGVENLVQDKCSCASCGVKDACSQSGQTDSCCTEGDDKNRP